VGVTLRSKGLSTMAKTKLPRGAKTAFIRAHANLSAKELVEAAAKEGIKLSPAAIYNARSVTNKSKGKKAPAGKTAKTHQNGASSAADIGSRHLISVVDFVRVQGGLEKARKAIETLASLQLN
jgi:hypothetical protein